MIKVLEDSNYPHRVESKIYDKASHAPGFYEKMGYKLEFIRKNSKNPKLNKYFYVKPKR